MASQEKSRPARDGQQLKFGPTVTAPGPTGRVETDQFTIWRRIPRLEWRCPACGEPGWIEGPEPGCTYLLRCRCGEHGRLQTYPLRDGDRHSQREMVVLDTASRLGEFFSTAAPEPVAAPEAATSAPEPPATAEQGDEPQRPARRPCRPALDRKKAYQVLDRDTIQNWLRLDPALCRRWRAIFGGSKGAGTCVLAAAQELGITAPFERRNRRTRQQKPGYTLDELHRCLDHLEQRQSAAATPAAAPAAAVEPDLEPAAPSMPAEALEAALDAFAKGQLPVVRLALRGPLRIEDGVLRVGTICGSADHAEVVAAQVAGGLNDDLVLAPLVDRIEVRGPGVTLTCPYPAPEPGQQEEVAA